MKNNLMRGAGAALGSFLLAATSQAAQFGDGGVRLQAVFDGITVNPAGVSSVDVTTDEIPDGRDSTWCIGGGGGAVATLIVELAGAANANAFGIYDGTDPSTKVVVAPGSAVPGNQFLVSILADGSVYVNFADSGVDFAGNCLGFFLDATTTAGPGVWYSDTSLNTDGLDHMYAYQGTGDIIQISPFAPGPFASNEYILAFEDWGGAGSDRDFDDFVILVESVSPLPDGGTTLLLLGLGLIGVARFVRRS